MPLCSICEAILCDIFSDDSSRKTKQDNLERWYRFPAFNGCQLCSMMEVEISKDLFEGGFARISFEGSSSVIQGFIKDASVFTFPVQMEELDRLELLADVNLSSLAVQSNSLLPGFISTSQQRILNNDFDWSTAKVLSETTLPQSFAGFEGENGSWAESDDAPSMTRYRGGSKDKKRARLARTWIQQCHDQHYLCKPHRWRQFSPTRLIDVERNRLVETRQQTGSPMKYAAFTHCWGPEMPEAGMTKQENLESHKHKIDFYNLPKSFRDAILVAKSLGIRYIWIDSLCIIQNSIDDWEFESAQMGLVYSYAWCTIAASGAKNCHEGMHLFRKETEVTCELIAQDSGARRVQVRILQTPPTWEKFYQSNPLNKRGWTFQERELSPRVLHFSADQIWWECRTLRKQEDPLSDDIPLSSRLQRRVEKAVARENIRNAVVYKSPAVNQAVRLRCLDNMLQRPMPAENTSVLHKFVVTEARYNTWHRVIEDYSTRAFSRITDRFPALSGLASEMQAAHGGEYVAGAWRDDLLRSLLWRRDPRAIAPPHSTIRRPPEYRAPSWSWAAIDEAVTYDLITLHRSQIDKTASTTAHIEAVNLVPNGSDPKGQLKDGFICMRGKLKMHKFSNMSRDIKFHMDFELASDVDDEISVAPLFLLSLFARTAMIEMQQPLFSLNVTGWALVLVMVVEDPEPIFRRVGVASDVVCEWFEDAMNVMIKII